MLCCGAASPYREVRKQALGSRRAAAVAAGALFTEAAASSAAAVADSAASAAGLLAVDSMVAAAAEASGSFGSFDTFDDASEKKDGTAAARRGAAAAGDAHRGNGEAVAWHASGSFDYAHGDDDRNGASMSTESSSTMTMTMTAPSTAASYAVAEMPGTAALGALAMSAAESRAGVFPPLGVPLTPAGLLSLYDGILPNLVKEGPPLALYLGIYEALKATLMQTDLREQPVLCYLVAGAAGELIGSVLRVPAEAIKSTQQSNAAMTLGEAAAVNFADAKGRENTFKAWQVAVVRDVPFGAIQIALFEALKIWLAGMDNPVIDGDSLWGEAVLGAFGGAVGSFVSAPADVVVGTSHLRVSHAFTFPDDRSCHLDGDCVNMSECIARLVSNLNTKAKPRIGRRKVLSEYAPLLGGDAPHQAAVVYGVGCEG